MINTFPPASDSVYGREKLSWYDKINFSNHVCHCGAVVKELLARADKPGSTPGDAVFCFLVVPFFFSSVWSLFFNTIFPFGRFSFILTAEPTGHAWLGSTYILSLSQEFYFRKGISKALDLHTGQAYYQKKTISCQDMSLVWNSWIFSMLVDIMTNNTRHTTSCTNLYPTPTSDLLAF